MASRTLSGAALVLGVMLVNAPSVLGKTLVVGPASCNPGPQHFATIQAAVNAAPAGSTVLVCPGTYREQVVINRALIIRGIVSGTSGAAIIAVPGGGLIANATTPLSGPVAAMVTVQNTADVKVRQLIIDGAGSTCPAGANRVAGILLDNVGLGDPSWGNDAVAIENNVIRNLASCDLAEGVLAENSGVTINSNEIHDIGHHCIAQNGNLSNINNNKMQSCHVNGILMTGAGAGSTVTGNTIFAPRGIELDGGSTGVTVSSNRVGPFVGIGVLLVQVSNNTVKSNEITASYTGVHVYKGGANTVQSNEISNAHYGLVDEYPTGGNNITKNIVNEAAIGLVMFQTTGSGDTLTPNSFFNCVVTTSPVF